MLLEEDCGPGREGVQRCWAEVCAGPQPPASHWVPCPWVTWCPEAPFGTAPYVTQQELSTLGVASQAWRFQEKHLLFLVQVSSFAGVEDGWHFCRSRLRELSLHTTPCAGVSPPCPSSPQSRNLPGDLGHLLPEDRQPSLEEGGLGVCHEPSQQ